MQKCLTNRFRVAILILTVCFYSPFGLALTNSSQPNVIIYVTDDQGLETISAYDGHIIKTPNLDEFAAQGAQFMYAFASASSCAVSRSNILSGQHGHVNGMYGHQHAFHHFSSFDNTASLPLILKKAGYRTARIGKYHLAPKSVYKFDKVYSSQSESGLNIARSLAEMADVVMDFASQDKQQPFFLYMAPSDPHRQSPHKPTAPNSFGNRPAGYPDIDRIRVKPENLIVSDFLPDIPEVRAELVEFYESIARIDQGFGRLIRNLKQAGVYDNTLIFFLSDNGTPMPNAKTTLYDTGIRLPLLVKAPNQKVTGKIENAMVSWVDITPTVLDYVGINPKEYDFNGRSFKSVLEGQPEHSFDRVFASHTFHEITMYYPMRMIRTKRFKLIWNIAHKLHYPTGDNVYYSSTVSAIRTRNIEYLGNRKLVDYQHRPKFEFYDLAQDPHEVHNQIDNPKYQADVESMYQALIKFMQDTKDPWIVKLKYE